MIARFLRGINALLQRVLEHLLVWLVGLMALTVLYQVGTRLLFRLSQHFNWQLSIEPSRWTEELASFLLVWIALLGASFALRRGEHMGFDSLFEVQSDVAKNWMLKAVQWSVLGFALILIVGGSQLVWMTLELGQTTAALRWPMGWVYAVAPLSGLMMFLFACERVYLPDVVGQDLT